MYSARSQVPHNKAIQQTPYRRHRFPTLKLQKKPLFRSQPPPNGAGSSAPFVIFTMRTFDRRAASADFQRTQPASCGSRVLLSLSPDRAYGPPAAKCRYHVVLQLVVGLRRRYGTGRNRSRSLCTVQHTGRRLARGRPVRDTKISRARQGHLPVVGCCRQAAWINLRASGAVTYSSEARA